MAVPSGDQRDHDFAKHFNIDIKQIFDNQSVEEEAYIEKDVKYINSEHINGLSYDKAINKIKDINCCK